MKTSHCRREHPRGFVVVVVVMLLGVMAAVVTTQLKVIEGQEVMGLRSEEEVRARAIAEGCLGLMQAYVDDYAGKNRSPTGTPTTNTPPDYFLPLTGPQDFDRLLDPDLVVNNTNDFMPTFGARVVIPNGFTGTAEGVAKHQWKLLRRDGGACLMRFEDNSDDFYLPTTLPSGANLDPLEIAASTNAFRDVPQRDRDRAIYLVVAGVFPASGTDAQVYGRAHARVTLRRLFAAPVPRTPVAGVFAGGVFESKNGATVCGVGGVEAGALDFKNVSCMCGPVEVTASLGKTPITTGCGSCSTCAPSTVTQGVPLTPQRYDVNGDTVCGPPPSTTGPGACDPLPAPPGMAFGPLSYRANEGLGTAATSAAPTTHNIGNARSCNFYGESDGDLYVWDRRDTDVAASITALGGTSNVPAGLDCSVQTPPTIPTPCAWDPVGNTVTCGAGQSGCWKLIAKLGDANAATNIGIGAAVVSETNVLAGGGERWGVPAGAIPNVSGARRFGALAADADYLCGNDSASPALAGAPSCSNCASGTARPIEFQPGAVTDQWILDSQARNENLPVPAIFVLDTNGARRVAMNQLGNGGSRPTRLTVLTNQSVRMGTSTYSQCCATCSCSAYTTFFPACGTETGSAGGFAVKADQDCILDDDLRVTGHVHCGDFVDILDNPCVTGNIAGYGADAACAGSACTSNVGVCFRNNATVDGTVFALQEVCGKNNSVVRGGIYTEGDVVFKNNFSLNGQLYANGDIELKNNAVITFTGNGAFANLGSPGLTTFMEAAW